MSVVHVVPHISREASGPSYSVPRLCQGLARLGYDVELSCLAANGPIPGVKVDVHPQWPILERFAVSTSHAMALRAKAVQVAVVHNHSLWSMVNVAAGVVVPDRGAKLVTSPRGTLSTWALSRSPRMKGLLWAIQRQALARADLLHATSEAEYRDIRARRLQAPVAVIPNGVDVPPSSRPERRDSMRTLLFMGRIHPTKGVDRLLRVWRELERSYPDWRLMLTGPGFEGYEQAMRDLAAELEVQRAAFAGPLYGAEKWRAYAMADLLVLPSHSENFGMVVAEALAHGCPAVVTRGAPWEGLIRENCGWWVGNDDGSLHEALAQAMSLPRPALTEMGARGRGWMKRDFGWDTIARKMDCAYRWMNEGGPRPSFVYVQ